jgi:hypothetical protein
MSPILSTIESRPRIPPKPSAAEEADQMKAAVCARYGPPEVLHIEDVDKPSPTGSAKSFVMPLS